MTTEAEIKKMFWKELDDSPFVMLGLAGVKEAHQQPMTAQFDDDVPNKLFFFCSRDNNIVASLTQTHDAVVSYASKGHDLFACLHGRLSIDNDPALIDKFWSPHVAAWFPEGRDDPSVTLLRFDAGQAELWKSSSGHYLKTMAKALVGGDPRESAQENVVKTYF